MLPNLSRLSKSADAAPIGIVVPQIFDFNNLKDIRPGQFTVQHTRGDGDCFYHAMASLANYYHHPKASEYYDPFTSGAQVDTFRNDVANVLDANWDTMATEHEELRRVGRHTFLRGVRSRSKWAGDPEVDAALTLFDGVKLAVWTDLPPSPPLNASRRILHSTVLQGDAPPASLKTWHLLMNNDHYEWMRPIEAPPPPPSVVRPQHRPTRTLHPKKRVPPKSMNQVLREMHNLRIQDPSRGERSDNPRRVEKEQWEDANLRLIEQLLARERQEERDRKLALELSRA